MSIIFQFGDFFGEDNAFDILSFLSDFFVEVAGAFCGFAGAYYLFSTQLKANLKEAQNEESVKHHENYAYFKALLKNIFYIAKEWEECTKEYIETINAKLHAQPPNIKMVSFQDLKRLTQEVNQQELYHSFLFILERNKDGSKEKNIEKFIELYSALDTLNAQLEMIISTCANHLKFDHPKRKKYSEFYVEAKKEVNDFLNVLPPQEKQILGQIIIEHIKQKSKDETSIEIIQKTFHDMLSPYADKYTNLNSSAKNIKNYLIEMNNLYQDIIYNNTLQSEYIDRCKKIILDIMDVLKNDLSITEPNLTLDNDLATNDKSNQTNNN